MGLGRRRHHAGMGGWLMMGFGIFFTLLVGGGLIALIFYSNRAGFDETPELELPPEAKRRPAMRKRRQARGIIFAEQGFLLAPPYPL